MQTNYKLILLDFDGTLCNTKASIAWCIKASCQQLGYTEPSAAHIENLINRGLPATTTLAMLFSEKIKLSAAEQQRWLQCYRTLYKEQAHTLSKTFAGAAKTLGELQTHSHLVVVSNKGQAALEKALQYAELEPYIEHIFGNYNDRPHKPNPLLWEAYIAPLYPKIKAAEVLMVGDAVPDLQFANRCGFDACWMNHFKRQDPSCSDCHPKYQLHSLPQLLAAVQNPMMSSKEPALL